jgi:hypothetical protein
MLPHAGYNRVDNCERDKLVDDSAGTRQRHDAYKKDYIDAHAVLKRRIGDPGSLYREDASYIYIRSTRAEAGTRSSQLLAF